MAIVSDSPTRQSWRMIVSTHTGTCSGLTLCLRATGLCASPFPCSRAVPNHRDRCGGVACGPRQPTLRGGMRGRRGLPGGQSRSGGRSLCALATPPSPVHALPGQPVRRHPDLIHGGLTDVGVEVIRRRNVRGVAVTWRTGRLIWCVVPPPSRRNRWCCRTPRSRPARVRSPVSLHRARAAGGRNGRNDRHLAGGGSLSPYEPWRAGWQTWRPWWM
jgi:hypothetical protein